MDRRAWWATVLGVIKTQTSQRDSHTHTYFINHIYVRMLPYKLYVDCHFESLKVCCKVSNVTQE